MKRNHIAFRMWGGITVLLVLVSLIACSESSKSPSDETVEVRLTALATKALTVTNESYELDDSGGSNLYWTYTAVKADNYFKTGQVTDETALNTTPSTDDDGNETTEWTAGLPSALPGKYSLGDWVFTFNAYTSDEMSDDYLFYRGIATSKTLTTSDNTVSVTVELYEAVKDADEDGNTYGTLVVYGITFTNQDGETQTLSDITLWYSIDGGELTEDADEAMLAESSESGLTFDALEPGSHTFYAYVTDTDGTVLASGSASAIVKPNLTTTITGSIEEDESATTSVTLGDLSISYGSISVSSEAGLTAALSDSEVSTVVLTDDISSNSTFSLTSEKTIDLNGNDMEISNYGFFLYDGASLTIVDGSDEDEGSIYASYYAAYMLGTSSLTIEGGTLSSYYDAVLVYGDDATIAISGGTVSSISGAAVWVYSGNSNITISGGTLSAENDSAIYIQDGDSDITITGGDISGTNGLVVMNTVDSANITISGGTITGSSYALTVNGLVTSETPVTLTVTDGEFDGLVYLAGYCTTVISGGTFTSDVMQALHMRSGSLNVTGGTFKGTQPESGYDYEYIYAGGGSAALYGDIAIEASSGYPLLSAAVAGSGVSLQSGDYYGIHYYLDPEYADTTPELDIDTSLNYTAHTGLVYRREVTTSGYTSWRLYYSDPDDATATTYTVTIYGTDYTLDLGDLEVQDSSSETGWSTYSASSEE